MARPPGNLVFGRRRFMQALAPGDGVLGTPQVLCPADNMSVSITIKGGGGLLSDSHTFPNPAEILTGGGGVREDTHTVLNPAVTLTAL